MIEFKNVSFQYSGDENANSISDLNLSIKSGECVLLCGPSGCGKSTIVRMVNGLIPHFFEGKIDGKVFVDNNEIANEELYDTARKVGTVFQNPRSQFFTVDTNSELAFGCENMGIPADEILSRVEYISHKVHMEKLMNRSIFKLSGGEKQKIACASVATSSPDIIILDEPSANLDQNAINELKVMIELWKSEKKTILIAEHRLSYCLEYVDRVIILNRGQIVNEMTREQFTNTTDDLLKKIGLRTLHSQDTKDIYIQAKAKEYMTIKNLKFGYKKHENILNFDNFKIPVGEIVAIVGPNGTGKSTFLNCVCGIQKHCKAVLEYRGKEYDAKQRLKLMYLVMQDVNHQLFTESVLDEVLISMKNEDENVATQILESLDLKEYKHRHPMSLSGGQKQRVAVASAIASEREIILFDEPTSGLDYKHMMQVSDILRKLKNSGKTVLIVTHDTELILNCCTCVLHLDCMKNE